MSSDTKDHVYELEEVSTHQPASTEGSESGNVNKIGFMQFIKVHVRKFLAFILLIILTLVVVALHKQMMLQSDWEEGYNHTRTTIKALNAVSDNLLSNVGGVLNDVISLSPVLIKLKNRVTALNLTTIIQKEWDKAGDEMYYHKFSQSATYQQAQGYCQKWTGRLAAGVLRNNTVVRNVSSQPAWVGYNNFGGTWHWVDGGETNLTTINLQAFNETTNIQNETPRDCGFIESSSDGTTLLRASRCNATISYICEVEMNYAY